MTVATSPRPKPEAIPDHPGVYLFRDRDGRVIYVGKAISLRKRTARYFQPMRNLHPRTAAMVEGSATLEWMLVQSEVEALQLEVSLIKQHRPRYNVRYRDDKSYPWLAVPLADEIPRPRVERGAKRKGTRYFGPYAHAYAIRETLDLLLRTFPMRTCSKGVFDRHRRLGRPCILFDINKCSGPCVGKVTPTEHRRIVEDFVAFMDGRTRPTMQRLAAEMRQAAEQLNFELAARLRDQLGSVRKAMERQQMVSSTPEDFDIAAFAEDDLEAAVQVFFVRPGRHLRAAAVRRPGRRGPPGGVPSRPARRRRRAASLAGRAPRRAGRLPGAPAGREAGPAGDGRGQRPRGLRHPQAEAGQRLRRPGPWPQGAPGGPRPARGPAADRVLRHLQPPGQPGRRVDGGVRGRPAPQERVPPLRGPLGRGPGRRGLAARGPDPPPGPPGHRAQPAGGRGRPPQEVRLPAEPDRGRRWPAPVGRRPRGGAGLGQPRPAGGLAGQADGGGVSAGHARPGGHPPDQRGPVPAAAGPRRGPPVRHHLPPQAARPVDDPQRARRHPRGGGDPPTPAGAPFRVGPQGRSGQPGRAGGGSRCRPPAC